MDARPRHLLGHDSLVACWRALASQSPDAHVEVSRHWVSAIFPEWSPLNNVIAVQPPEGERFHDALEMVADAYAQNRVGTWALWIPAVTTDFDAPDRVHIEGLERDTTTLVMRADLDGRFVAHDSVRPTSVACAASAGDIPVAVQDIAVAHPVPGLRAWVMLHEDIAVAGLWTMVHGEDCGVYGVGTVPAWRRRGFARRLVGHALADAAERGARTASLQSTPMGQPLYESLGFTAVGRYEEWLWEPETQPESP